MCIQRSIYRIAKLKTSHTCLNMIFVFVNKFENFLHAILRITFFFKFLHVYILFVELRAEAKAEAEAVYFRINGETSIQIHNFFFA